MKEAQVAALHELSIARKQSMAQLIRTGVNMLVERQTNAPDSIRIERAKRTIGRFASGTSDGSRRHDHSLADAYAQMIFADTSSIYAILDRHDETHARASATWLRLTESESSLLYSVGMFRSRAKTVG